MFSVLKQRDDTSCCLLPLLFAIAQKLQENITVLTKNVTFQDLIKHRQNDFLRTKTYSSNRSKKDAVFLHLWLFLVLSTFCKIRSEFESIDVAFFEHDLGWKQISEASLSMISRQNVTTGNTKLQKNGSAI